MRPRATTRSPPSAPWVRSTPVAGSEFRIVVPITLAVLRCLLVEAGGQRFALPFHRVVLSQAYDPDKQSHAEGRPVIWVENRPVAVSPLLVMTVWPTWKLESMSMRLKNAPPLTLAPRLQRAVS